MIVIENGEWESESDRVEEGPRYDEDYESNEMRSNPMKVITTASFLFMCLVLPLQRKRMDSDTNLFHTRGMIKEKLCRIIVENGSCNNIASQELVDRIELKQRHHPNPYKMQWLNDCAVMCVNHVVTVSFSIGRYNEHVECDVVPVQACQLLLGRP